MVNGNSEEEVKDTAATDAEPEAEVVDAEIVERLIPPNLRGMKLPKKHLPKLLLRKQKKKQLNGRANTSDFMRNGTPIAVA